MAKDLNKAMIIGRLTKDPEMRTTQSGQQVTSFGVATNRSWKNASGEQQEQVEFHNVVVWGRLAEICTQYLSKGSQAYFEGRLQTRQWEGQDGAKRQSTEIVAEEMILLDTRNKGGGGDGVTSGGFNQTPAAPSAAETSQDPADSPQADSQKSHKPAVDTALDDIPF